MAGGRSNRAKNIFYLTHTLDGQFVDFGCPDITSTHPKINAKQNMLHTNKTIPDSGKCTA